MTDDQRQALGETLVAYFSDVIDPDENILRFWDYHDSRNIDDLIDVTFEKCSECIQLEFFKQGFKSAREVLKRKID
jgi:hypothetical protein